MNNQSLRFWGFSVLCCLLLSAINKIAFPYKQTLMIVFVAALFVFVGYTLKKKHSRRVGYKVFLILLGIVALLLQLNVIYIKSISQLIGYINYRELIYYLIYLGIGYFY